MNAPLSYLSLLRRRPAFRALFLADLVSNTGDWFSLVAISILAADHSGDGGGLALALVLCAHLLPGAVLGPVAGFLADRFDRRRLLVVGGLLEGTVTLGMVAAAAVPDVPHVGVVQLLLLLRSAIAALREPAAGAALPHLVKKEELATANALAASAWSTTFVVGMALGGLATELGVVTALAIDAASFFCAALVFLRLPALGVAGAQRPLAPGKELLAAARLAVVAPLRGGVFGKTPMAFAGGAAWVALNLNARSLHLVGGAAVTLGLLQALRGVGTGVGPLLARAALTRTNGGRVAHVAAAVTFAGTLAVCLVASLADVEVALGVVAAVIGVCLWGLGGGALWVITQTEIQHQSSDDVRGKMLAFDGIGFALAMSFSALFFGAAHDQGVPLPAAAVIVVVAAALAWGFVRSSAPLSLLGVGSALRRG